MKLSNLMALAAMIVTFAACSVDYPSAPGTGFDPGTADFSNYAAIGNSLTAGYQNGGLRDTFQMVSYPQILAAQFGLDELSYNPFPDSGTAGSLFFGPVPFSSTTGSPNFITSTISTTPTNSTQPTPYENLGVPGAFLFDFLYASSSANSWQAVFSGGASTNALFNAIVRGSTQFTNLKALQPTFVTFHLGNNDVLGYATNGAGTNGAFGGSVPPYTPVNRTDPAFAALSGLETLLGHPITFDSLYARSIDSLMTLGADVVLVNIPNVTAIPYFTAVNKDSVTVNLNPLTRMALYKSETDVQYVTLAASRYIGSTTFGAGAPAPFGLHPANPLTGNFTLTTAEVTSITAIVAGYNAVIDAIAEAHNLPVVRLNSFFNEVATVSGPTGAGYPIGSGISIKTDFISGGFFSLDGVHPSTLGYAIAANEVIKTINSFYGSSVPLVNLSNYIVQ